MTASVTNGQRARRRAAVLAAVVVALVAVRVVAIEVVLRKPATYAVGTAYSNDAENYHRIADHAGEPYKDFAVEFPPVTLGLIEVINGHDVHATMQSLAWVSLLFDLAAAAALAYGWGRRAALAYLVLGLPLLLRPFVYFRIDLLSVALAAWACALVKRRHDVAGGGLLAVAVFAKIWPLALVPALAVQRRGRALAATVVAGAIGAALWVVQSGTQGIEQVVTFRHARGWQFESVPGELVRVATGSSIYAEAGAIRTGTVTPLEHAALALLLVGLTAWVWWKVWRSPRRDPDLAWGPGALTAVTVFMVCSPLLSPQYVVWLLPFAALCWVTGDRVLALLTGGAATLTMLLTQQYPALEAGAVSGHAVLLARNALLVAIVAVGLRAISRPHRPPTESLSEGKLDDQVMSSMRWSATRAHSAVMSSTDT
jgi:hypothetical protein